MAEPILTSEEIGELELALIDQLSGQGLAIDTIKLIGLKGSGYHSTVFTVLINDEHHVLKLYHDTEAYQREIKHLRRQIPLDRLLLVWPAELHQFKYNIVIIQVPEGLEMGASDLNPVVAQRLVSTLLNLHTIRYRKRVSTRFLELRLKEKSVPVLAHVADYEDLDAAEIRDVMERAIAYLRRHAAEFRIQRSRCHGDLWWSNIIVAEEDVYLIDWENVERDDYCDDLSKFWVMTEFERRSEPTNLWAGKKPDEAALTTFMESILDAYQTEIGEANLRGRFGFYGLLIAWVLFGGFYYADKRGSDEAKRILLRGIKMFETYCQD